MPTYLDTGTEDPSETFGAWLDRLLEQPLDEIRLQFGYFRFGALRPFIERIQSSFTDAGLLRLVIGSNDGSLTEYDALKTLEFLSGLHDGKLIVCCFRNASFHPKVVQARRRDGTHTAIVGSANLTDGGLAWNVEAAIAVDTAVGDDSVLCEKIARSIDAWFTGLPRGAYLIKNAADIRALTAASLIDVPQTRRHVPPEEETSHQPSGLIGGTRTRLWRATPSVPGTRPSSNSVGTVVDPHALIDSLPVKSHWCKELKPSDAQQVQPGTNPTGKLRLAQAGFPIEPQTHFRHAFFDCAIWESEVRSEGKVYEVASIEFDVYVGTTHHGRMSLVVDHATHRESNQRNVTTVLAWGPILGRLLTRHSLVGHWVVLLRDLADRFYLVITPRQPQWAPQHRGITAT